MIHSSPLEKRGRMAVVENLRIVAADAMNELARLTNRIERRVKQVQEDRQRQQQVIREAFAAGVTVPTLAGLARVSEARIYQIIAMEKD
jgi:sirohydrochlorin ferrochelatase